MEVQLQDGSREPSSTLLVSLASFCSSTLATSGCRLTIENKLEDHTCLDPGSTAGVDLPPSTLVWKASEANHKTTSSSFEWNTGFGGEDNDCK